MLFVLINGDIYMKIIIIGAGLAGLTYAALAAQNGHEVIIYEKNNDFGS